MQTSANIIKGSRCSLKQSISDDAVGEGAMAVKLVEEYLSRM